MNLRRNILIFHAAALGDFIVTWPLALALGRLLAQSRIIYVTHAGKGKLAEKVLKAESSDAESGWHALHADSPELPESSIRLLRGAQAIFCFGSRPDDQWTKSVNAFTDAPITHIDTKPPDAPNIPVTQLIAEQLSAPIQAGVAQMIRSIETRGIGFPRQPGSDIVIHPGGGAPAKCWPIERYIELIKLLKQQGSSVRVLIGEVEKERWPAADLSRLNALAELRQPETLLDLLQELSTARAFVGNDSGPGHLSAIIGVPTVSIFGSDPTRWRPIGPETHVVQGDSIDAVVPDQVLTVLQPVML